MPSGEFLRENPFRASHFPGTCGSNVKRSAVTLHWLGVWYDSGVLSIWESTRYEKYLVASLLIPQKLFVKMGFVTMEFIMVGFTVNDFVKSEVYRHMSHGIHQLLRETM